ncbi:type IV toxin-antitoxin system AbiEi family antitoxin domain-containing protein [Mycolicibacterium poriferae]|nr:type IV toxin-antitoxin system AbiEi family antitoxin domain-containing protein [Mycolicibacterium poriferae]
MAGIAHLLAANGGVVSTAQLRAAGWTHPRIKQLREQGWLRLRRG